MDKRMNRVISKLLIIPYCWWSGVVVSALASVNEVNLRRARLVLRWTTVSGFNSRCQTVNEDQLRLGRQRQVWFIPLADERGVCRYNCEIPWERVPYLSVLEVWLWQGTPRLPLPVTCYVSGATSLNYLHMALLPVLTSMFDHLGRNGFGNDLLGIVLLIENWCNLVGMCVLWWTLKVTRFRLHFNQSINLYCAIVQTRVLQCGYAKSKRNVLRRILNVLTDGAVRQFSGREFQSHRAATEKRRAWPWAWPFNLRPLIFRAVLAFSNKNSSETIDQKLIWLCR